MQYKRMPIEIESPEQLGYNTIDFNLAESSVHDAQFKDLQLNLNELMLCYGNHVGKPELRELIAAEYKTIKPDDVLLTTGAASALFIVATSLLKSTDHLIVVRPNYASNIETPRAIGCQIDYIDLVFEEKFELNVSKVKALIKTNTKLISITSPHNPTGTMISERLLKELIQLAETYNCVLLVDETYRDIILDATPLPLAASLSPNVISVSSVSKAYGLPGIRIGWLITKNIQLQELFLAAKEQIFLCNSVVDEEIAFQFLLQKQKLFPPIQQKIKANFEIVKNWIYTQHSMEWVSPKGGVVCFPRIKTNLEVDIELFYQTLNEHKTLVGAGHWFEADKRFMRIGFGWPTSPDLKLGLSAIDYALNKSVK